MTTKIHGMLAISSPIIDKTFHNKRAPRVFINYYNFYPFMYIHIFGRGTTRFGSRNFQLPKPALAASQQHETSLWMTAQRRFNRQNPKCFECCLLTNNSSGTFCFSNCVLVATADWRLCDRATVSGYLTDRQTNNNTHFSESVEFIIHERFAIEAIPNLGTQTRTFCCNNSMLSDGDDGLSSSDRIILLRNHHILY